MRGRMRKKEGKFNKKWRYWGKETEGEKKRGCGAEEEKWKGEEEDRWGVVEEEEGRCTSTYPHIPYPDVRVMSGCQEVAIHSVPLYERCTSCRHNRRS